jgi:hypothetical protein
VEETIILAPEILTEIHKGLSSVPLLEMEAQPLKDVEKAEIYLQVMLSAL